MQANRAIPRLPLVTSSCSIGNDTRYRPYNRTANCLCTIMLGEITKTPFSVHRRENKNQRENRVSQELNVYNREREREREREGKKEDESKFDYPRFNCGQFPAENHLLAIMKITGYPNDPA